MATTNMRMCAGIPVLDVATIGLPSVPGPFRLVNRETG